MSVVALKSQDETTATVEKVTTPEALVEVWPFVRSGLNKIKRRQREGSSFWTAENVRASIVSGQTELFLVKKEECVVGFLTVQIMNDPFLNVPMVCFVWHAHSVGGGVAEADWFIQEYAKSRGCRWLECLTQRKGLVRRLSRHGWYEHLVVARKDLYTEV